MASRTAPSASRAAVPPIPSPPRARPIDPWYRRVWAPGVVVHLVLATAAIFRRDLWFDEALSLAATRHFTSTAVHTGGNMIGYYALLTPWAWISQAPAWLRVPSVIAMTWAIGLLSVLVARIAGQAAGRWAGLFAACAFLPVRYAAEVRSYAFVALMVTASWYCVDRVLAGDARRGHRQALRWCVILLPLFHGLAILQVIALAGVVVWARPDARTRRQILRPCAVSVVACLGLYTAGARNMGRWIEPLSVGSLAHFARRMVAPYLVASGVLIIVAAVGAWILFRGDGSTPLARWRRLALTAWGPGAVVLLLLLSVVRPSELDRYAIASAFGFAGLLAVAATRPARRVPRVLAPLLVLSLVALGQGELTTGGHDWAFATMTVSKTMRADDAVVFEPVQSRLMFEASLVAPPAQQAPRVAGQGTPLGTFDRFGSAGSWAAETKAACAAVRLWIVSDSSAPHDSPERDILHEPCVASAFRVAERWESGTVTIRLMARR